MSDGDWTVMVVTEGGAVSILKGLTEEDARQAAQRLTPHWRRPGFKFPDCGSITVDGDRNRVSRTEGWGPGGRSLVIWPRKAEDEPTS